jgi:predicted RNA-binding Zn-ribbon protein involved in translation (DUF1610 family)
MVRRLPAAERLDRTQFRSEAEYLDHVVQLSAYRCPHCGAEIEFLGRHVGFGHTTAGIDVRWRSAFDTARPLEQFERALDFRCPGCAPARIVYAQMSDLSKTFDWDLLEVVEADTWPEHH